MVKIRKMWDAKIEWEIKYNNATRQEENARQKQEIGRDQPSTLCEEAKTEISLQSRVAG